MISRIPTEIIVGRSIGNTTVKNVRVNFYEFTKPLNVKYYSVSVPVTKQGQAQPVQVVQFDKKNMTIV